MSTSTFWSRLSNDNRSKLVVSKVILSVIWDIKYRWKIVRNIISGVRFVGLSSDNRFTWVVGKGVLGVIWDI